MRIKGTITTWKDDKGFGFIKPNTTHQQIFVHVSSFVNRSRRPEINQPVYFVESEDKQGTDRMILSRRRLYSTMAPKALAALSGLGSTGTPLS